MGCSCTYTCTCPAALAKKMLSLTCACTQLHKEMQQSLAQLRQIQYELRSGMNVLDTGYESGHLFPSKTQQGVTSAGTQQLQSVKTKQMKALLAAGALTVRAHTCAHGT